MNQIKSLFTYHNSDIWCPSLSQILVRCLSPQLLTPDISNLFTILSAKSNISTAV